MSVGWVYILVNAAMPDLVKIGRTARSPYERAAELSSTTGVPTPFAVAYAAEVSDAGAVEREIHHDLLHCRNSSEREFFAVKIWDAIHTLQRIASKYTINAAKEENNKHIYVIKISRFGKIWTRIGKTSIPEEDLVSLFKNKDRDFYLEFFIKSEYANEVFENISSKLESNEKINIYNIEFVNMEGVYWSAPHFDRTVGATVRA